MNVSWLRSRTFWLLILAGIGIAIMVSFLPTKEWSMAMQHWLKSLGFWAFPAFVGVYLITATLGVPNVVLILAAGTLFGFLSGIASASIADTLSAAACYGLGRTVARKRIKKLMQRYPQFAQLDRAVDRQGWKIILFSRLSPVIPSNVLNYGFSCTRVNFWQYLFFTWMGMLPVIWLYVYIGYFGVNMLDGGRTPQTIVLQTVGLTATIAAAIYTTRLAKTALSQAEQSDDS